MKRLEVPGIRSALLTTVSKRNGAASAEDAAERMVRMLPRRQAVRHRPPPRRKDVDESERPMEIPDNTHRIVTDTDAYSLR